MKPQSGPVPLAELAVGDLAQLHHVDLEAGTDRFLRAIGLTHAAQLRVCRNGEPCIIQVRSTRVGLARAIADRILVVPIERPEV
jgi:Fe2+ transport system protein FeoA